MTFLCIECRKDLEESYFYKKVKNKCKDCLNKKLKCQVCGNIFTKKWLTTYIERNIAASTIVYNVNIPRLNLIPMC